MKTEQHQTSSDDTEESENDFVSNIEHETSKIKHEKSVEYLLIIPPPELEADEIPVPIQIKTEEGRTSISVKLKKIEFEENAKKLFKKVCICRKCPKLKVFKSSQQLKNHLAKVKHIMCTSCGLFFQSMKAMTIHKCVKRKNVNFICDFCPKEFACSRGYLQHIDIHFDEKKVSCKICGNRLVDKRMPQHMRQSHGKKEFECDLCSCFKTSLFHIRAHMKSHLKPWQCKICEKKFSESRYFNEHVLNHKNPNPFPCLICESSYTRKTSLNRHMQTAHSKARNFSCSKCKYKGKTKDDLTTHQKSHSKLYKCDVCKKRFSRSSMLKEHRVLHDNPNAYQCKICLRSFTEKKAMKNHIKKVHVWK